LGCYPNKQKLRFPASPEIAVSSLCGNKDTACYFGDIPNEGGDDCLIQQLMPKLQWEEIGLPMRLLQNE